MRRVLFTLATLLAALGPAAAYDEASQALIDRLKPGKPVPMAEIGVLMMGAERWCYGQKGDACAWSEIYLWADADGAGYELSNPWSETVDIAYVAQGEFRDGRFCDIGVDWLASLRAYIRPDGMAIEGRDLAALRDEIGASISTGEPGDCFNYLYRGHDAGARTVTLLQRQFVEGMHQPDSDTEVTLHFDKASAESLGWYL